MPKSSSEMRQPRARKAASAPRVSPRSSSRVDSVISRSRRWGGRAGELQRLGDHRLDLSAAELRRGQVDRDADIRGPGGAGRARAPQDRRAEILHQTDLLDDRDELGGRDDSAHGMAPARQRLERNDPPGRDIEDRLEIDVDRVLRDGGAQFEFDQAPDLDARVHRRLERAPAAAAVGLRRVESDVGVGQQRVGGQSVVGSGRGADADADDDLAAVDHDRLADRLDDPHGEFRGGRFVRIVAMQNDELVAAPASPPRPADRRSGAASWRFPAGACRRSDARGCR